MNIFATIKKRYQRLTSKQFVLAGVFMLVFAAAIGAGFASKQTSGAAVARSTDSVNSIDNRNNCGGIGAVSASELVCDIGKHSELKGIYSHFGMQTDEYDRFKGTARFGTAKTNGDVIVDGQKVMYGAWSIGRTAFSYSTSYKIDGVGTYRKSMHTKVLNQDLPVMVMFDSNGTAEFAVINACGNPVGGNKIKSGAECKGLNKFAVKDKKNTYQFSAVQATTFGLAKVEKYRYSYNDGSGWKEFGSTNNAGDKTEEIEFTKASKVKVEVEISLPGGKTKLVSAAICEKEIGVVKEEFLYVCDALIATARDNTNRKFRFTVITKQSNNVSVDSADFTLDDQVTTKGVTDKDQNGNFFKDYDFNDAKTHKVSVIVNFTADGKKVTSKQGDCVARVTPEKEPVCPHNPNLPPDHPDCKPPVEECVPEGKEDENCELPSTGPAGIAGLFVGVTAAGAIGHRLYASRRNRG